MLAEKRVSANHTSEQAIKALRRAGITVDSCVTELATNSGTSDAKPSVGDEELVANTLQQIEALLNGLAAQAPEGEYSKPYPQFAAVRSIVAGGPG